MPVILFSLVECGVRRKETATSENDCAVICPGLRSYGAYIQREALFYPLSAEMFILLCELLFISYFKVVWVNAVIFYFIWINNESL